MKVSKNIFSNFSAYLFFEILNKLLPFVLLPVITSNISVAEFGELGIFNSLSYFFIVLISLNHYTFLAKEYYNIEINGDYLFYNLLIQTVGAGLFVFIVSMFINFIFGSIYSFSLVALALLSSFLSSMNTLFLTYFITKKKPLTYGLLSLLSSLVLFIVVYLFVEIYKLNYHGRIFAQILSGLTGLIIAFFFYFNSVSLPSKRVCMPLIKRSLLWTLPLLPHTLSFWAKTGLDTLFIDNFLSKEFTGIYAVLLIYTSLWMVLINALFNVITPEFNSKMSIEPMLYSEYIFWGCRFALLIIFLLGTFYFFAVYFTKIFLPANYAVSLFYLKYILPSLLFNAIYAFLSLNYFFYNKTKFLAKVSVITAVLHVAFVFTFAQKANFELIILSQSVSSFIMILILFLNLNSRKGFSS